MNMLIPFSCVVAFGRVATAWPGRPRALMVAMVIMVGAGAASAIYWRRNANRRRPMVAVHVSSQAVEYGRQGGPLWRSVDGGLRGHDHRRLSDGAVNGMHESFTPLGGGVAMFMIQLAENSLPGGVGSGLYGMVRHGDPCRCLRGWLDGRPHAGVSGEEDRGPGDEAGQCWRSWCMTTSPSSIFAAVAAVLPIALKTVSASESVNPRPVRDHVCLYVRDGEQRLGLCGGLRPEPVLEWDTTMADRHVRLAGSATPCRFWPSPAAMVVEAAA